MMNYAEFFAIQLLIFFGRETNYKIIAIFYSFGYEFWGNFHEKLIFESPLRNEFWSWQRNLILINLLFHWRHKKENLATDYNEVTTHESFNLRVSKYENVLIKLTRNRWFWSISCPLIVGNQMTNTVSPKPEHIHFEEAKKLENLASKTSFNKDFLEKSRFLNCFQTFSSFSKLKSIWCEPYCPHIEEFPEKASFCGRQFIETALFWGLKRFSVHELSVVKKLLKLLVKTTLNQSKIDSTLNESQKNPGWKSQCHEIFN